MFSFFEVWHFYSGWLAYGSRLMYPHLPECIMRQFGYMQYVPRDPSDYATSIMAHWDVDAMYNYFLNHLVSDKAQGTLAHNDCSVTYGYIQWYFRVSHPYMKIDSPKDPSRPSH